MVLYVSISHALHLPSGASYEKPCKGLKYFFC